MKYPGRKTNPRAREVLAPIGAAVSSDDVTPDSTPTLRPCPACVECKLCDGRHYVQCSRCNALTEPCPFCADCLFCSVAHAVTPARAEQFARQRKP